MSRGFLPHFIYNRRIYHNGYTEPFKRVEEAMAAMWCDAPSYITDKMTNNSWIGIDLVEMVEGQIAIVATVQTAVPITIDSITRLYIPID